MSDENTSSANNKMDTIMLSSSSSDINPFEIDDISKHRTGKSNTAKIGLGQKLGFTSPKSSEANGISGLEMDMTSNVHAHNSSSNNKYDKPMPYFQEYVNKYKEEMRKRRGSASRNSYCKYFVDRIQNIYLPKCCCSTYESVSTSDETNDKTTNSPLQHRGRVPLVRGLEPVIRGSQPAADSVYICGIRPYRYLFYMLSGFLCDFIQFGIDVLLFRLFHLQDPSACWALGFGISIVFRHTSHRYLIFGDYVGGYWNSLTRMYAGYSIIILISTVFNYLMTRVLKLDHYVAWIITLLWTGIVNYFILKKIWSFDGKSKEEDVCTDAAGSNRPNLGHNNRSSHHVV